MRFKAGAALTIIIWDALVTFILLRVIGLFMKLRMTDEELEAGDVAAHEEEVYPSETLTRVGSGISQTVGAGSAPSGDARSTVTSDNS